MSELTGRGRIEQKVNWDTWKPDEKATLLFLIKAGRVLLMRKKRGLGAGKFTAPGGRFASGEHEAACAVRETHEEVGVQVQNPLRRGELWFQFTDGYALHVTVFSAVDFLGEPKETEEALPKWFPLDDLPFEEMWEDDRFWIPLMLAGKSFVGRFLFDNDKMMTCEISTFPGPKNDGVPLNRF